MMARTMMISLMMVMMMMRVMMMTMAMTMMMATTMMMSSQPLTTHTCLFLSRLPKLSSPPRILIACCPLCGCQNSGLRLHNVTPRIRTQPRSTSAADMVLNGQHRPKQQECGPIGKLQIKTNRSAQTYHISKRNAPNGPKRQKPKQNTIIRSKSTK